jgi:hypothetical protein
MPATFAKIAENADRRVRRMARVMFNYYSNQGECTRANLLAEGFSNFEIDTLHDAAWKLAETMRVRDVAEDRPVWTREEIIGLTQRSCVGLSDRGSIFVNLRREGLSSTDIGEWWPDIHGTLVSMVTAMPAPSAAEMRRAFA